MTKIRNTVSVIYVLEFEFAWGLEIRIQNFSIFSS